MVGSVWLRDRSWLGHVGRLTRGNHLVVPRRLMSGALAMGLWVLDAGGRSLEAAS